MQFNKSELFEEEVRPVVEQLMRLCRKHDLPLVMSIGVSRQADEDRPATNDVFQTCRVTLGKVGGMSSNMLAAGMLLNDKLARAVRDAVLGNLMDIAIATFEGEDDEEVLEAARFIAAYSAMWRVIHQAGVASRPGSPGFVHSISPEEAVDLGAIPPDVVEKVQKIMRSLNNKLNEAGDDAYESHKDKISRNAKSDLPEELYNQLRDMFGEGDDQNQ